MYKKCYYVILIPDSGNDNSGFFCGGWSPLRPPHDECEDAIILSNPIFETCSNVEIENVSNFHACVSEIDYGNCGIFNEKGTVYYQFTTDNDAATIDIELLWGPFDPMAFILIDGESGCGSNIDYGGCISGGSLIGQAVEPNHTYYIVIASEIGSDYGVFDLNVEIFPASFPGNDLACDAILLTEGIAIVGNTVCTGMDIAWNSCSGSSVDENQVWYSYTTPASGANGFSISFEDISIIGDAGMAVYLINDCDDSENHTLVSGIQNCDIFTDGPFEYYCLLPNTEYLILVGSSSDQSGEFEITISDLTGSISNDLCLDAIDVITGTSVDGVLDGDCVGAVLSTTNMAGCPESFSDGCGFDVGSAVWYKFTAGSDGVVEIQIENESFFPSIGLYNGDCIGLNLIDCTNGDVMSNQNVLAGETYYVLIGTGGGESSFDLNIILNVPPVNDWCEDAIVLEDGDGTIEGTTECASIDVSSFNCDNENFEQSVWYEFQTGSDVYKVNIFTSSLSIVDGVILVFENNCPIVDEPYEFSCELGLLEFCVLPNTTYFVLIGSSFDNEGSFEISFSNIAPSPSNDICSGIELLNNGDVIPTDCIEYSFEGNNQNACHEYFNLPSCSFDLPNSAVVWYEFTTDENAELIDVNISDDGSGGATYSMAIFTNDCENPIPVSDCGTLGTDFINGAIIMPNTTYFLLVASDDNFAGPFNINIIIKSPPENDDCTSNNFVVHELFSGFTLFDETTVCASPDVSPDCSNNVAINTVWYEHQVATNVKEIIINISNWTSVSDVYLMAVVDCNSDEHYEMNTSYEYCGDAGSELLVLDCPGENDYIYFLVGTEEGFDGNFDIEINSIEKEIICTDNDNCADADTDSFINIMTDDPTGETCITDCNRDACPEDILFTPCLFNEVGAVWYSITTDNKPDASLNLSVSSFDFNPAIAILTDDCSSPLSDVTDCVLGDGSVAILNNIDVLPNTTYLVLVGSENGGEGDFEICIEISTICNDEPCSPVMLLGGFEYNDPSQYCTTNIDATEDFSYSNADCGSSLFESSVYFSYQVTENLSSFELVFNNVSMTGDAALTLLNYDASNCDLIQNVIEQDCNDANIIESLEIFCPPIGNIYLIQVSSSLTDQGDFSLEIIENQSIVDNDACQTAILIDNSIICETISINGSNETACPEEFVHGTCTFEEGPFVWYQVTIPSSVGMMNVSVEGSLELFDPIFAIIETNCNVSPIEFTDGADCITSIGNEANLTNLPVEVGNSYWIVIGSETDNEGDFVLEINLLDEGCGCPDLSMLDPRELCNGADSLDLNLEIKITDESGSWDVLSGPFGQDVEGIINENDLFVSTGIKSGLYEVEFKLDNPIPNCDSIAIVTIVVVNQLKLPIFGTILACNKMDSDFPVVFNFNDLVSGYNGEWMTILNSGGVDDSDFESIDFSGIDAGMFIFEYCTNNIIEPCANICESVIVELNDCDCPPSILTDTIVCITDGEILLDELIATMTIGSWNVISGPSTVDVLDGIFKYDGILAGKYIINYTYDTPIVNCDSIFELTIEVMEEPVAVLTQELIKICGNNPTGSTNTILNLYDLIESGNLNGIWTSLDFTIPPDGIIDFDGILTENELNKDYSFNYYISGNGICDDNNYEINIEISNCSCYPLELLMFNDLCNDDDLIDLNDFVEENTGTGSWSVFPIVDISNNIFNAAGLPGGIYTFTFILDDQLDDCPKSLTQSLEVFEPGWAGEGTTEQICNGKDSTITLFDLLSSDPNVGGIWLSDVVLGFDEEAGSFNTQGQNIGEYKFTYSFGIDIICNTVSEVVVSIVENPIADAGVDLILDCIITTVELNGSSSTSGLQYQWFDESGPIIGATDLIYSTKKEGKYIFEVYNPVTGCTARDEVYVINSGERPSYDLLINDPTCYNEFDGSIKIINLTGGDMNYSYQLNEEGFISTDLWNNLGGGSYVISVMDGLGCMSEKIVELSNPDLVDVQITPDDHEVEMGTKEWLSIVDGIDIDNKTIIWSIGDSIICDSSNGEDCMEIEVVTTKTTTYSVTLIDIDGCSAVDMVTISTIETYDTYIPNIFDPTSDDISTKYFYISDDDDIANINRMSVYSRWGDELYNVINVQPGVPMAGWDGLFKGELALPGVYVYHINVSYKDGTEAIFVGDIIVIR